MKDMENTKKRILLCEDEDSLGMLLREYLQAKGYEVELCTDGEMGYNTFCRSGFDICLLDVMMPKMDGFTLGREIRIMNENMPIIFLTAKNLKEDILHGFKVGADDYLTKPFSMDELVYRIEAIFRRMSNKPKKTPNQYELGKYLLDTSRHVLYRGEETIKLTGKETQLLTQLYLHRDQMLERDIALKAVWAEDNYFNARSMDVYISKLRKLFKDDPTIEISNVHGKGYKLIIRDESELLEAEEEDATPEE